MQGWECVSDWAETWPLWPSLSWRVYYPYRQVSYILASPTRVLLGYPALHRVPVNMHVRRHLHLVLFHSVLHVTLTDGFNCIHAVLDLQCPAAYVELGV